MGLVETVLGEAGEGVEQRIGLALRDAALAGAGDEARALEVLAREELAIDPQELGGSAWEAAAASFLLFAFGAATPVLPFLFLSGAAGIYTSLAVSAVGLFVIGAGTTLFTARPVAWSGARQILVGLAASGITFGIGRLIGVSLT